MDNNVNLVLITDNNYVMQVYITLMSIYHTKNIDSNYYTSIIGLQLTPENKKILLSLQKDDFKINIIDKSEINMETLGDNIYNFSPVSFLKLELGNILSNIKKVLYLDSDIIVKKDLKELYNNNLKNFYIGACKDIEPNLVHIKKDNTKYDHYFNAGIMLLNLQKIREDNFFEKVKETYQKKGAGYLLLEQDALNETIDNKIILLSPVYNWITSNCKYTKKQLRNFYCENIQFDNITVIHYAGYKPWIDDSVYFAKDWEYYYKQSPFYDKNLKRKHKYNIFIRYCAFFRNQIKIYRNKKLYEQIGIIR